MKDINNNIQEAYCSFEICKLLKEKRFDIFTEAVWVEYHQNTEYYNKGVVFEKSGILHGRNSYHYNNEYYSIYSSPSQALAIEWIRINFNIWIHCISHEVGKWCYHIGKTTAGKIHPRICENGEYGLEDFDSPQEATEAALLYVLQNLI